MQGAGCDALSTLGEKKTYIHRIETTHTTFCSLHWSREVSGYQDTCEHWAQLGGGGIMTRCLAQRDSISAIWSSTKLRMSDK